MLIRHFQYFPLLWQIDPTPPFPTAPPHTLIFRVFLKPLCTLCFQMMQIPLCSSRTPNLFLICADIYFLLHFNFFAPFFPPLALALSPVSKRNSLAICVLAGARLPLIYAKIARNLCSQGLEHWARLIQTVSFMKIKTHTLS